MAGQAEQKRFGHTPEDDRSHHYHRPTRPPNVADLAEHEKTYACWFRAQSQAQTELARALCDIVRKHAVESDRSEQCCKSCEAQRERSHQAVEVNILLDLT